MANAIYWDTSALIKLYAPEPDSNDYLRLLIWCNRAVDPIECGASPAAREPAKPPRTTRFGSRSKVANARWMYSLDHSLPI